jgi:hypothetical protein
MGKEPTLLDLLTAAPRVGARHAGELSHHPQARFRVREQGTGEAPLRGSSAGPTIGVIALAPRCGATRLVACAPSLSLGAHRDASCCAITLDLRTCSGPAPRGLPRPLLASLRSLESEPEDGGLARCDLARASHARIDRNYAQSCAQLRSAGLRPANPRMGRRRSAAPILRFKRRASSRAERDFQRCNPAQLAPACKPERGVPSRTLPGRRSALCALRCS